uniref:Uncharacterized protein n=1 Tax=Trichogramma kaykai TaxID=54128 RepID=A0ABD2XKH5_9HYME
MKLLLTNKDDDNPRYWIRIRKDDGVLETDDSQTETRDYVFLMKSARQVHLELCITARKLNNVYEVPILLTNILLFFNVIGTSHTVYITLDDSGLPASMIARMLFGLLLELFFSYCKIMYLMYLGSSIIHKSEKTSEIAHKIQFCHSSIAPEIELFNEYLSENPLALVCYGFRMDCSLIKDIICETTTFLIIITQAINADMNAAAETHSK